VDILHHADQFLRDVLEPGEEPLDPVLVPDGGGENHLLARPVVIEAAAADALLDQEGVLPFLEQVDHPGNEAQGLQPP
jgi:hypothetical protein